MYKANVYTCFSYSYTGEDATTEEPSPEPVAKLSPEPVAKLSPEPLAKLSPEPVTELVADDKHLESDIQEDNAVMESTEFILIFQSDSDEEESGVEEREDEEEEKVEKEGEEVEKKGEEVEKEEKVQLGRDTTHLRDDDSEVVISRTIVTVP